MKYSIIPEADRPIKCHCNAELYLALEMENLSLTDGYPVQPVPWRQSVNARDASRWKSQFMRSAKLPVRDVPLAARKSAPGLQGHRRFQRQYYALRWAGYGEKCRKQIQQCERYRSAASRIRTSSARSLSR